MYDVKRFSERLVQLRMEKGISARIMSMELGLNVGYINRIENGKALPSLPQFFNICDYFEISPADFFNEECQNFTQAQALYQETQKLTPEMAKNVLEILKKLNSK